MQSFSLNFPIERKKIFFVLRWFFFLLLFRENSRSVIAHVSFNVDLKFRTESMMDPRKTMISTMICIVRKNQRNFHLSDVDFSSFLLLLCIKDFSNFNFSHWLCSWSSSLDPSSWEIRVARFSVLLRVFLYAEFPEYPCRTKNWIFLQNPWFFCKTPGKPSSLQGFACTTSLCLTFELGNSLLSGKFSHARIFLPWKSSLKEKLFARLKIRHKHWF